MEPNRVEFQKQCIFQSFCKRVLHNEACNAHEEIRRRRAKEVSFSDLALHEERQLYTLDKYFQDEEAEPSYQQAGKKSHCVYRWIKDANEALSIETTRKLMQVAVLYSVDCIVFERLDSKGKIRGGRKFRERIHLWRKNDVQKRVTLQAHRLGMRISRVCAWGTSKYAFDGSGAVDRHSIYYYKHGRKVYNYSLCTFQNGKIYNCDLSAAQNIGARFFLREYQKLGAIGLPSTPLRTLSALREYVNNGMPMAA